MASFSLRLVRFWIPVGMVVGGVLMIVISPDIVGLEGFAFLVGGAAGIAVSNRLHRMSIRGEKDRVGEADARVFLDRYGLWPDQATPGQIQEARESGLFDGRGLPSRAAAPAALTPDEAPTQPGDRPDRHRHATPAAGRQRGAAPARPRPRRPGPHDLRR